MCQSTNTNYACGHWGPRKISSFCSWAIQNDINTGCYDTSHPEGVEDLEDLCPGCKAKGKLGGTSTFTHVDMDEVRRPLTRESIAAGKLNGTLEKQEEAAAKEIAEELSAVEKRAEERKRVIDRINRERRKGQSGYERRAEWREREKELEDRFEMRMAMGKQRHEEKKRLLKEEYSGFGDELEE